MIEVGTSGEPEPNVRVCAQLMQNRTKKFSNSNLFRLNETPKNLAAYMFVWHSDQENQKKRSSAYRMTDQFPETSSELHAGEYVKIILSKYSSIQKINVCTLESAASLDVRVLDFDDPNDRGDKGSKCILQRNDTNNAIIYHALEDSSC